MRARVRRALARVARAAPVRLFVVEGLAPPESPDLLCLHAHIQRVDSPRSATILLLAGELPPALGEAARRVHDEMAIPRLTVSWRNGGAYRATLIDTPHDLRGTAGPMAKDLARLQAGLFAGTIPSETAVLPDVEPSEWRDVGPYGQGGEGMTGGVPYGRPMAETAPDRDGLRLDRLDVKIGPFFPPFPPGLVLTVGLQGDVLQDASVAANPFAGLRTATTDDIFRRSLAEPVRIAALEVARSQHQLRWLGHALRVHGLAALGRRALALSASITPGHAEPIAALRQLLERTRALAAATDGVAVIDRDAVRDRGLGPVARASDLPEDGRVGDEAYRALGFEPVTHSAGDARARWRQRLAEAEQSVVLAGRAGEARTGGVGRIEAPRGVLTPSRSPLAGLLTMVPALLPGMEWGDAVTTVISLDLDLRDLPPAEARASVAQGAT